MSSSLVKIEKAPPSSLPSYPFFSMRYVFSAFLLSFLFLGAFRVQANVKMPVIFGDHMVLQQDTKLPVWGWADPGESVTVTFANQSGSAVAGSDGTWRVDLNPVPENSEGEPLTITGNNTVTFHDVIVGDVWIASGQSNMQFGISRDALGAQAVAKSDDRQLRLFCVAFASCVEPQTDMAPNSGHWMVCTPENLGGGYGWDGKGFSAVGYYFAREIRQATGRPVGMIDSTVGGTRAQAWLSVSGLQQDPSLAHYADEHRAMANALPKPPPLIDPNTTAALFNGMIAPLIPFAIKGVIWYQGESNSYNFAMGQEYASVFARLIGDWREKWGEGDFPFLYVQLANFIYQGWSFPMVRESQLKTLALPATGMAVAVDIGNPTDIHPADKTDVGHRLALAARHVAYGENIVYSGPIYDTMTLEGSRISLSFKDIGGGLTMGVPPWTPTGQPVPEPTELTGFEIAGDDKKFVPAKAEIDGDSVVVSSDQVSDPTAVRYDWDNNPVPLGNLYNKDGLPASPFRTDTWPE
jgi:sialate O-acetylesterase